MCGIYVTRSATINQVTKSKTSRYGRVYTDVETTISCMYKMAYVSAMQNPFKYACSTTKGYTFIATKWTMQDVVGVNFVVVSVWTSQSMMMQAHS